MEFEQIPWSFICNSEPSKDQEFWVWDDQLERIIKGIKWFHDENDWGSADQAWSGSFAFWMYPVENESDIASPYTYTVEI